MKHYEPPGGITGSRSYHGSHIAGGAVGATVLQGKLPLGSKFFAYSLHHKNRFGSQPERFRNLTEILTLRERTWNKSASPPIRHGP
ncbi:MAG: hypothetical protein RJA34_1644 [Pseudomonadota bacterium]